ncbi:hypothetical protein [Natrinema thermotolerans]
MVDQEIVEKRERLFGHEQSLAESRDLLEAYSYLAENGPLTSAEWRAADATDGSAKTQWEWLRDHGFLTETNGVGYAVPIPIHVTAHAFELKLEDWERGIEQVKRASVGNDYAREFSYGYASHRSVVVDGDEIDAARENHTSFWRDGIGLYAADRDGLENHLESEEVRPPRASRDLLHLNEITYADRSPLWGVSA